MMGGERGKWLRMKEMSRGKTGEPAAEERRGKLDWRSIDTNFVKCFMAALSEKG